MRRSRDHLAEDYLLGRLVARGGLPRRALGRRDRDRGGLTTPGAAWSRQRRWAILRKRLGRPALRRASSCRARFHGSRARVVAARGDAGDSHRRGAALPRCASASRRSRSAAVRRCFRISRLAARSRSATWPRRRSSGRDSSGSGPRWRGRTSPSDGARDPAALRIGTRRGRRTRRRRPARGCGPRERFARESADRVEAAAREAVEQRLLRVVGGLAGGRNAADVRAVDLRSRARQLSASRSGSKTSCRIFSFALSSRIGHHQLDAAEEVARHPVGARDVDLLFLADAEGEARGCARGTARRLEDTEIRLGDAGHARPQAADAAHGERDRARPRRSAR